MESKNVDIAGDETLSKHNPIADFLKLQKDNLNGLSEDEFIQKYESHMKKLAISTDNNNDNGEGGSTSANRNNISDSKGLPSSDDNVATNETNSYKEVFPLSLKNSAQYNHDISSSSKSQKNNQVSTPSHHKAPSNNIVNGQSLSCIVLKFTTFSESCLEAPSFTVDSADARIGRDSVNEINVPSDNRLANVSHAVIEYHKGSFYIVDCGYECPASIRIGLKGSYFKNWIMEKDARFSVGNTTFACLDVDMEDGSPTQHCLIIEAIEGPLKGQKKYVKRGEGATIGRSSENAICVPDRELSRKHSKIEFDERLGRFIICDIGSTNGTYMQLTGPYGGRYKLSINDHILVGRTGFSINRFDYGISEEIGHRQTMEDAAIIVQHLNVTPLGLPDLFPQSFFGVFDGHGGNQASSYLAQTLHVSIAENLLNVSPNLLKLYDDSPTPSSNLLGQMDKIVIELLKTTFVKTDSDFITKSLTPQHGSTATTALILGNRLYCANVGDSRTLLCRNFQAYPLSDDHKPSREDEFNRIRQAGGFVINNRVMGELAVSRAFGDVDFKRGIQSMMEEEGGAAGGSSSKAGDSGAGGETSDGEKNWDEPLIIADPEIRVTTIGDEDQFLLLACDGLFDVFTNDDLVQFVRRDMEEHGDAQRCCQHLTHEAIKKRNSRDNVSVILVVLRRWY